MDLKSRLRFSILPSGNASKMSPCHFGAMPLTRDRKRLAGWLRNEDWIVKLRERIGNAAETPVHALALVGARKLPAMQKCTGFRLSSPPSMPE
jgi:hypothetical protein